MPVRNEGKPPLFQPHLAKEQDKYSSDDGYGGDSPKKTFLSSPDFELPVSTEKLLGDYRVARTESVDSDIESMCEDLKTIKKLGSGQFGDVWLVKDENSDSFYAFKVPLDKEEQDIIDRINHHPNIVKSYGAATIDNKVGLLLEYIPGLELSNFLKKLTSSYSKDEISLPEFWGIVQYIFQGILSGIRHMEKKQHAHQDIKPQNIMIDRDNLKAVIIDLGRVGKFEEEQKPGMELYSTPEYHAAEQSGVITDKVDIYAVGQLLYSLMAQVVSPGKEHLFSAGAIYEGVLGHERQALYFRLYFAMERYRQTDDVTGEYKKAMNPMNPITMEELDREIDALYENEDEFQAFWKRLCSSDKYKGISPDELWENDELWDDVVPDLISREKKVGRYLAGYEPDVVKFINKALHPLPEHRLNAKEALEHPFLASPICNYEDAQITMKKIFET